MNAQTTPPSAGHAQHDRWLVVRFASHDELDAAESAAAHAQLTSCPDCSALVDDLATIARATALSLTPSRPRDFRLSPEQAAAHRGSLLTRLLNRLSSPGAAVARPLASAALGIGLVLVVASTSLPTGNAPAPAPGDPSAQRVVGETMAAGAPSGEADLLPSTRGPFVEDGGQGMTAARSADPELSAPLTVLSPAPDTAVAASPESVGTDSTVFLEYAKATSVPNEIAARAALASGGNDIGPAVLVLGVLLALTGGGVLLLTWLARRSPGDPLLR